MLHNQRRIGPLRYPGFAKAAAKKRPEGKAKAKAAARATAKAEAKSAAEPFLKVMDVVKHGKRSLNCFVFFSRFRYALNKQPLCGWKISGGWVILSILTVLSNSF